MFSTGAMGRIPITLRCLVFEPWPLCKTEVHLKISEHKILSFSVKKKIIENDNSCPK